MGRLRATLSATPLDKEIATKVEEAKRLIFASIRACELKTREDRADPIAQRVRAVKHDLQRVLGALSAVRRVSNGYALDIPVDKKKESPEEVITPVDTVDPGGDSVESGDE